MAAFLTINRMTRHIESFEDLVDQRKVKFGLNRQQFEHNGFDHFKQTNRKMYGLIEKNKEWNFDNEDEAVRRAVTKDYVAIMDLTSAEYLVGKDCQLELRGEVSNIQFYAVGLQKGRVS